MDKSARVESVLKEWGFDGVVMSDWGAVNDRVRALWQADLECRRAAACGSPAGEAVETAPCRKKF